MNAVAYDMSHLDVRPRRQEQQRGRLVADRFRRIWHVVEDIAATPGQSRRELANKFHLSERQVQADLNIMRVDMRLPLLRRQGYRFVSEAYDFAGVGTPDLREAQLLVMILRHAMKDRSIPRERLASLLDKLPAMFPPHLVPIVARTVEAVRGPQGSHRQQVFAALADALLRGVYVKLHYPPGDMSSVVHEPIVCPEVVIPYLSSWYVIGECRQRRRSMMFRLDTVEAVTLADAPADDAAQTDTTA